MNIRRTAIFLMIRKQKKLEGSAWIRNISWFSLAPGPFGDLGIQTMSTIEALEEQNNWPCRVKLICGILFFYHRLFYIVCMVILKKVFAICNQTRHGQKWKTIPGYFGVRNYEIRLRAQKFGHYVLRSVLGISGMMFVPLCGYIFLYCFSSPSVSCVCPFLTQRPTTEVPVDMAGRNRGVGKEGWILKTLGSTP